VKYINQESNIIHHPNYVNCEPTARATWWALMAKACMCENNGVFADARAWTDRAWQQICGVTLEEVNSAAPLVTWIGADAHVWNYCHSAQDTVEGHKKGGHSKSAAKAEAARMNGANGGRPRKTHTETETGTHQQAQTETQSLLSTETHETQTAENPRNPTKPNQPNTKPRDRGIEGGKDGKKERRKTLALSSFLPSEKPNPLQSRLLAVGNLKFRQADTRWQTNEFQAFRDAGLEMMSDEDFTAQMGAMARYYLRQNSGWLKQFWAREDRTFDLRRRDLLTLLNNWSVELDRAREFGRWLDKKFADDAAGRL